MAKKSGTLRVHTLARELGVDSTAIVAKCRAEDVPNIENHMSVVPLGLAESIREWFSGASATAVQTSAAVDIEQARAKAKRKTSKRSSSKKKDAEDSEGESDTAVATEAPPDTEDEPETPVVVHEVTEVMTESDSTTQSKAKAIPHVQIASEPEEAASVPVPTEAAEPTSPERAAPRESEKSELRPAARASEPTEHAHETAARKRSGRDGQGHRSSQPSAPVVMNRPERPKVVSPAGPQLSQPTKTKLAGPKIIRVESPEVISPPKRSMPGGGGRPGPRTGRGTGPMSPTDMPLPDGGERGSRRNKRRTSNATNLRGEEMPMGKSSRMAMADQNERQGFNWRQQDLLERENRLNRAGGFFKAARRDNLKKSTGAGHRAVSAAEGGGQVAISEPITVKSLSAATGMKAVDIVRELMMKGDMVTINSTLATEAAVALMLEHSIELVVNAQLSAEQEISEQQANREMVDERRRSPVVTILGHVDHGKTTLLDKIRNANVAAQEAGGITQATSAFQVPVKVGDQTHQVTFIDTPGHEAFTAMRERGAKVTDIVVLVVAADDGVMPQTVESINHAKAAGVPIVVALNKIDKPEATTSNLQRIYGQLAEHGLNPVEWGGQTELVKTSAVNNQGITDLLEVLDYQAQLRDLKADFGGPADGTVLEASMEEGRGAVARVLVQQGTLHKGDIVVVGHAYGRVRDVVNDRGERVNDAEPSVPVAISGLDEVPNAGDRFYVMDDLRDAEAAASERKSIERQKSLAKEKVTLDNIYEHLAAQGRKELALVVKSDVQGSAETLAAAIGKIKSDEIVVSVKHSAVGGINESDVSLAAATGAIIVGFNVTASAKARRAAEDKSVELRFYDVIYDLIDDVTKAAEGLLEPELKLEVLGHAEVRDVFKISKVGMVAGCYVTDGVIERNAQIRVTRNDIVIEKDRRLQQLKRFKDDAKEVRQGQECGMLIDGYNDIKPGDVLECYRTKVVQRKL